MSLVKVGRFTAKSGNSADIYLRRQSGSKMSVECQWERTASKKDAREAEVFMATETGARVLRTTFYRPDEEIEASDAAFFSEGN